MSTVVVSELTENITMIDESGEGRPRQKIHRLGEQRLAGVHERLWGGYPGIFSDLHFDIQIDTKLFRAEPTVIQGFQRFALSFHRTVVI